MMTNESTRNCASNCWYIAVGLGLLLSVVLIAAAGWSLLWGLLLGVVVFLILGFVLPQLVCTAKGAHRPMAMTSSPASHVVGDPPATLPGKAPVATPQPIPDEPAPQAHPVAQEARKPAVAEAPKAKETPKPAVVKTSSAPAATDPSAENKPQTLSAARAGGADDLKMIKGIGPKLESALNDMGFYHYDQIAKWTEAEAAWVNANVRGSRGSATRDDWAGQAANLAKGQVS